MQRLVHLSIWLRNAKAGTFKYFEKQHVTIFFLIGFASKRLPPAAISYTITEVEPLGLPVNISQLKDLLAKVDFDLQ